MRSDTCKWWINTVHWSPGCGPFIWAAIATYHGVPFRTLRRNPIHHLLVLHSALCQGSLSWYSRHRPSLRSYKRVPVQTGRTIRFSCARRCSLLFTIYNDMVQDTADQLVSLTGFSLIDPTFSISKLMIIFSMAIRINLSPLTLKQFPIPVANHWHSMQGSTVFRDDQSMCRGSGLRL